MPMPVYADRLTQESEKRLETVMRALPGPVALAGGHAVRKVVGDKWRERFGEDYFGSRDIDICFEVDPHWGTEEMDKSILARARISIEKAGFRKMKHHRFGASLEDDGSDPGENEAMSENSRRILYLDPLVTNLHAQAEETLGVRPTYEPVLQEAFERPSRFRDPTYDGSVLVPNAGLLVATKLRSLPKRHLPDKQVKDLCDLYALLTFGNTTMKETREIIQRTLPNGPPLARLASIHPLIPEAARHLDVPPLDIRAALAPLLVSRSD